MTAARVRLLVAALVAAWPLVMTASPAHAAPADTAALGAAPPPAVCIPALTCDPVSGLAGDAARSAARAGLDALAGWIGDGARSVLDRVATDIASTTEVDVNASWFRQHFDFIEKLAAFVVTPMLMAAVIGALIHQDGSRLVRAFAFHLPLALLGGFAAIQLTGLALGITDQLCNAVLDTTGHDATAAIGNLGVAMRAVSAATLDAGTGGFLGFVVAFLVAVGALLVWLELVLRSAAIYAAVLFLPLTLSGLVWPVTARWARRLVEILVALILSKFVIVAVISLATGALASNDHVSSAFVGAALLLLAGFAPFALLRLVPVVEASVVGHLEGAARRPVTAGMSSALMVNRLLQGASGAGGAPAVAAAVAGAGAGAVTSGTGSPGVAEGDPGLLAGIRSSAGSGSAPPDAASAPDPPGPQLAGRAPEEDDGGGGG